MKIVVVSGGFDPIHSGHLAYFREAKELGMYLIVGVNSDEWLMRKKGYVFMPIEEREEIIKSIKYVNGVNRFNDDDDSAIDLLHKVKYWYPSDEIIFANGGDRNKSNCRELSVEGVKFVYGVGGKDKMNSSSEIVEKVRT
jgi:D-beta-D-heptose 7-phosphate kinase/D-beta-D-heptose 1-phosphate adenosyltransferase|tara:strand:+ start:2391 stop:2810 length:420 start_codon:yes stop_codon:yes gene_type:complete